MSAFGGKADITFDGPECPLLTRTGLEQLKIAALQIDL
jgi:hypothetical protein